MWFANPLAFLLLLLLIPLTYRYLRHRPALRISSRESVARVRPSIWVRFRHLLFVLRCASILCIVVALARPQTGRALREKKTEGLDIMLVVDTSGSMQALDFVIDGKRQDRVFVVKRVLSEFIQKRTEDRLGMVVFGTHAYTQAPLTLDHDVLLTFLDQVQIGMAGDATAIGDAIGVATNRLKELKAKSKIIILLTDGSNTAGKLNPLSAAEAAKTMGVKIYTIGIGSHGPVPIRTERGYTQVLLDLDDKGLTKIAETTGGQYFTASDTETLVKVYATIDQLEKAESKAQIFQQYDETFEGWVWAGLAFLLLELLLRFTRLRRVP
jgi:Ca-activated chloride channel family protein